MSLSSITRAASDPQLINRVVAAAHQVALSDENLADTVLGQSLLSNTGLSTANVLMYPVAIATEAQYETALLNLRGAPGFDKDIIPDSDITAAVIAGWPMTRPPKFPTTVVPA